MPDPSAHDASASTFAAVRTAEEREEQRVESFRRDATKRTEEEMASLATERSRREEDEKTTTQKELSAFATTTTETILKQAEKEASEAVAMLDNAYARHADAVVSSLTQQVLTGSFFSASKQ